MIEVFSGWSVSSEEALCAQKRPKPRWQDVLKVLLKMAHQFQGQLYTLIDTSRNEEVFRFLCNEKEAHRSLYQNTRFEPLYCVAPILLRCHQQSKCCRWLSGDMWGEQMATYFISKSSFDETYRHLANYSIVEDSNGVRMFFRLADPIVFHTTLLASNLDEQRHLMHPFSCVIAEYGSSGALFFDREHLSNIEFQTPCNFDRFKEKVIISDAIDKRHSDVVYFWFLRKILNKAFDLNIFKDKKDATERQEQIFDGVAQAEKKGLYRESQILSYLSLADKHGREFDTWEKNPEVASISNDNSLARDERLRRVVRYFKS